MEFISSIAGSFAKDIVKLIWRQSSYMINYSKNVDNLKKEVRKLKIDRDTVQTLVEAARTKGERILPNIDNWLTSANTAVEESEKFLNEEVKANQRCFDPSCPDLKSRFRVSREAKRKTEEIEELLLRYSMFNLSQISTPAPPPSASSMFVDNMKLQESRESTLIAIMEALRDENVNMVGVYGMGGVGKTTLVKEVAKQAEKHKLFDSTVITVVSRTPVVEKIQSEIAVGLGLSLSKENKHTRAGQLCDRLKQEKSVLIILDDLWAPFDLEAIGIAPGAVHQSFKVLLTTRDQEVCNMMNVPKIFPVDDLTESEAWILFREKAGNIEDQECAINIAKECAGLPIAIITVAASLRSKPIQVWNDALRQLRDSKSITIKGIRTDVYSRLQLSYDFLGHEKIKYFFLLCCLFPEDSNIKVEDLVRYAMGLRLFDDVHNVEAARDRAYTWVKNLKDCCLLLDGSEEFKSPGSHVRMHDVIRDFAIWVASNGEHVFLVRAASRLRQWPQDDALDQYIAISLLRNDIPKLPSVPYCSKLQVLLLSSEQSWGRLPLKISATFFESMRNLRVLTVSGVSIQVLPDSFFCLKDLRTLCLDNCMLPDLSEIGSLKNLEILSLRGCRLEGLPIEIRLLAQLRLLDLSNCKFKKAIESSILARLSRLECLNMRGIFYSWMIEKKSISACLAELEHLSYLSSLVMDVPDIEDYAEDITFVNLTRFQISIGIFDKTNEEIFNKTNESLNYSKALMVGPKSNERSITLQGRIDTLLKVAEYLRMENIEDALHVLESQGFSNLKCLAMSSCHKIEYLANGSFDKLRKLSLNSLPELMYILKVQTDQLVLPNLADLSLVDLPKLKCFCHDEKHRSKNEANLDVPPETQHPLFNIKICLLRFKKLIHIFMLSLERLTSENYYHNFCHQVLLPSLDVLDIIHCHSLSKLFLPQTLPQLQNLRKLSIINCGAMEEVLEMGEDNKEVTQTILFPKLQNLCLRILPELACLYKGNCILDFPALKNLEIQSCPKMRTLVGSTTTLFNEKVLLPSLEYLEIDGAEISFTELWANKLSDESFRELKRMTVRNCRSLSKLFSPQILPRLPNLRELSISYCGAMEEVLEMGEDNKEVTQTILFPKLQTLSLGHLPELACLYKGNSILDFPALQLLEIESCPKMRTLVGSTTTLFNEKVLLPSLKDLNIDGCHSLSKLFSPQTLPQLQNLRNLSIINCGAMEEVLEQGGHIGDRHVFPKVHLLSISKLPNLRSFCCGNGTLEWPTLSEIEVRQCPNMQNFSPELVIAPKLSEIIDGAGGQHFEGDLNSDIRRMSEYQKTDEYIEKLKRKEEPGLSWALRDLLPREYEM